MMTAPLTLSFDAVPYHQSPIDIMPSDPIGCIYTAASVFVLPRTMATARAEEFPASRLSEISGCPVEAYPAITAGNPFTPVLCYCLTFLGTILPPSSLDMRFLYSDIAPTDGTPLDDHRKNIVSPNAHLVKSMGCSTILCSNQLSYAHHKTVQGEISGPATPSPSGSDPRPVCSDRSRAEPPGCSWTSPGASPRARRLWPGRTS